jgi:hypothetical protein
MIHRCATAILALAAAGGLAGQQAAGPESDDGAIPQPFEPSAMVDLVNQSPFIRSLGVSDSVILTGVARIGGEVVATLLDTETMESHVVSGTANSDGWQLVGIGGDAAQPKSLTAKIQMTGGQVVSIRYGKPPDKPFRGVRGGSASSLKPSHLEEARKAAVYYKKGFSSDGFPREPPREIVEKLSRISVEQREAINRRMISLRNEGLGMEERRRIYVEAVNRSAQGRR